jgi:RND family efflux transporter MFP subunit
MGFAALGLFVSLAVLGCNGNTATSEGRGMKMAPYSAKSEERDIIGFESMNADLIVPPASMAEIRPPYRAPLKQVMVTVGKRVDRGDVLMELDLPDAEAYHEQARLAVVQAEQALASAQAANKVSLRDAQRQLEAARATERTLRDQIDPSGDASALVDATNVRQNAEREVQRLTSEYQAAIQPYSLQLEEARAAERAARSGAKQASVRSPIEGTVVELNAQPGQEVGEDRNQKLATIVDLDDLKLRAKVPSGLTDDLKRGEEVTITFVDLPDERFTGYIRGIRTLPKANGAPEVEAEIELRNKQGLVKPGMKPNRVAVQTERVDDVIAVPAQAVDQDETGRPVVKVLVNGEWKAQVVETGVTDGEWTEIKKGVKEGETVQVTPAG